MPRKIVAIAAAALLVILTLLPTAAFADQDIALPQVTEAQAYEIVDQDGNVLASLNPDMLMDPASITKVMTAVVALDTGKSLDDVCTLQEIEYQQNAQLIGIETGDQLTFRQLMLAMLVYSGNDAADNVGIAAFGSSDACVDAMNAKAAELGMTNTHFENTHGLMQDGHQTTAHDLAILARYAMENYPFIRNAVRARSVTITLGGEERTFESTDDLMETYDGLLGIKTGSVESGTTFLGASSRHGITLYSAVLGCETNPGRFEDTTILMDWAYGTYYSHLNLADKSRMVRMMPWALGFGYKVAVYPQSTVVGYAERGQDVTYSMTMANSGNLVDLNAPVGYAAWRQSDRNLGFATYSTDSKPVRVPAMNPFAVSLFYD